MAGSRIAPRRRVLAGALNGHAGCCREVRRREFGLAMMTKGKYSKKCFCRLCLRGRQGRIRRDFLAPGAYRLRVL